MVIITSWLWGWCLGNDDIWGMTWVVVLWPPESEGHECASSCGTVCEVDADFVSAYYHPDLKVDSPR